MNISPQWLLVGVLAAVLVVVFVVAAMTGRLEGRQAPMRVVVGALTLLLGLAIVLLER